MIEAFELTKSFGSARAVCGVSFACDDGHITGLLGPNGAGKTTTLRILSTVLAPDAGTATVDGHDIVAAPRRVRQALGILPDSPGLYGRLTAREHLRYFGRLHGLDGSVLESRVREVVELLRMEEYADRRCGGFSKGMQQKVALGRALIHGPRTIILDEPTAGLDVMSIRETRETLRHFKTEGRCILFSSHNIPEVEELCDRIVILAGGQVHGVGSPGELKEKTRCSRLEDAFVELVGTAAGLYDHP
ncbi:MAG: ATP-binding cassette domain-containing protein [Chloroflexi bacterium]|nr:ATP-binding cassette domain-containing protein [Chloroflexota bacterium]